MTEDYIGWDQIQRYATHLEKKEMIPKHIQKKLDKVEKILDGPNDKFNVTEYQNLKEEIITHFDHASKALKRSA